MKTLKKTMQVALLVLLLAGTEMLNAQQWKWAVKAGGGGNTDQNYDMATDSKGNVYWVGTISGTAMFGSTSVTAPSGSVIGVIAKYDSTGAFVWVRKAVSGLAGEDVNFKGISIDAADRIYITGVFETSAIFDGGITVNGSYAVWDMFIARLNTSGTFLWAKKEGTSGTEDVGSEIATDDLGNAYAAGYKSIYCYIWKFDSLGVKVWEKSPTLVVSSSARSRYEGISIRNGKIVATGYMNKVSATFGSTPTIGNFNNYYVFLVEYDLNGNAVWSKAFMHNAEAYFHDVIRNSYGDILVTGMVRGDLYLDNDTLSCPFAEDGDGIMAILDSVGNVKWSTKYGNSINRDHAMQGAEGPGGRWYVSGQFYGTVTVCGITISSLLSSADQFVLRMDSYGQAEWLKTGGGNQADYPLCIHVPLNSKRIYTGGYFWGTVTYGSSTIVDGGNGDAFMARMNDTSAVSILVSSSVNTTCPNTCTGSVNLSAYGTGTMIFTLDTLQNSSGIFNNLCAGVYNYTVSNGTSAPVSDTIEVQQSDSLTVSLSSQFYCSPPNYIISSTVSGGLPPYTYYWSDSTSLSSASVSSDSNVVFSSTVTDENGCSVTDSILINGYSQSQLTITFISDTLVVSGDTTDLNFIWTVDGTPISGTDNLIYYEPVLTGNYQVMITDDSVCIWYSNVIPVIITSLQDLALEWDMKIYPNPASKDLSIQFPAGDESYQLRIYNVPGQLVYEEKLTSGVKNRIVKKDIDISALGKGIYIVNVQSGSYSAFKRIVVQ
jgi:hypothetical protein